MKFKKEIRITLIVTAVILLYFWGHNFLKGKNLLSSYNYYHATFDRIDGLQTSNLVTINGFEVGLVSGIQFESEKLDRLIVEIGVNKNYRIPDNSIMTVTSSLLGSKSVELTMGNSTTIAPNGSALIDSIAPDPVKAVTDRLLPIADNADKLIVSIDSLSRMLQNTFDSNLQKNIQSIVANVEHLVAGERTKIAVILDNFESVSGNLQKSNEDISKLIANLNSFSATLVSSDVKATVDNANNSLTQLNTILSGINNGEGTLGKLTKDDSAYIYLQQSLNDLDKLLVDLRENPKNYVHFSIFGGKKSK